ncbi:4'-phosphopantetheinyl transferase superfamily protein [Bizionia sediminis]|uniref:4'-phosphopantetheinyl transferase superfamily protein n=1 Tax=Bizionia sediminis TaxID=1737064 RepID=A0ABW5KTY6_9FLAO
MIGNDIVDLNIAAQQSNWKRPRFLNKIFTEQEQQLIHNSKNQTTTVWRLWSMKEAAYKINIQQYGGRLFAPKKLQCTILTNQKGWVRFMGQTYQTQSVVTKNSISTIAHTLAQKQFIHKVFKINDSSYQAQSDKTKQELLQLVSQYKKVPIHNLQICKDANNIPQLFFKGIKQKISISMAHHGLYGGCGICW